MSAHKLIYQQKVVLDLTGKSNYKYIYSRLSKSRIESSYYVKSGIKIGKYVIFISPANSNKFRKSDVSVKYLSLNDNLKIDIQERIGSGFRGVKSNLIEDEPWFHSYLRSSFSIQDLTEAVLFCKRLEDLNAFS